MSGLLPKADICQRIEQHWAIKRTDSGALDSRNLHSYGGHLC